MKKQLPFIVFWAICIFPFAACLADEATNTIRVKNATAGENGQKVIVTPLADRHCITKDPSKMDPLIPGAEAQTVYSVLRDDKECTYKRWVTFEIKTTDLKDKFVASINVQCVEDKDKGNKIICSKVDGSQKGDPYAFEVEPWGAATTDLAKLVVTEPVARKKPR